MKIGIIGAGFTGLSAAFYLQKKGHQVTVFEKEKNPGGLALGFKESGWDWTLEEHYHHFFTNDNSILKLAKEINQQILTNHPKTSVFIQNKNYRLDSPLELLKFGKLSFFERIRMGIGLALLKYNPFWKPLEKLQAQNFLPKLLGIKSYKLIWEPQLIGKFGNFTPTISLAWFWARIKKRTANLSYPVGGFLSFAQKLSKIIEKDGGVFFYNTPVKSLENKKNKILISTDDKTFTFDKVIVTLPAFLFSKIAKDLPETYLKDIGNLKSLGAINMVLKLKNNFFEDGTYWLSICDMSFPFMAAVEHTNFINKTNYNNQILVYLGKYLPFDHKYFKLSDKELFKIYEPFINKLSPDYKKKLIDFKVFKSPFAQPIIPVNYSKIMPTFKTPLENIYLANIEQVYPWDRGTNYAVEMGEKIASLIDSL